MDPPPYAYVFYNLPKPPLTKLDDEGDLSVLHAKFWGVSIDQDERAWVEAHGQLMENDGSEVVQGCFALDLHIRRLMVSKLWVRKDYWRIYDHCRSHCESVLTARENGFLSRPPIAIITGQPGIGKSEWIFYAVRRRLGEAQPFLWYIATQWHLFVQAGVFTFPGHLRPGSFASFMWAFVDADDTPTHFPGEITPGQTQVFTIFTTSPRRERWKPLLKNKSGTLLIMNPWSWDEICKAADIHRLTGDQRTRAQDVFLEYGPTPQLCIDFVKYPRELRRYHSERTGEIDNLNFDALRATVRMGEGLDMEPSHSIILVKRKNADDLHEFTIEPITLSVKRLLKRQLMREEKERLRTYLQISKTHESRIVPGLVFESLAQHQLQEEVSLTLLPMVRVQTPGGRGNAKWQNQSSCPAGATNPPFLIQFKPTDTVEYEGSTLEDFQAGVFYVPMASNQVASFILVDQILYIFQFTIAASHDIKEGIMKFFSQAKLRDTLQGAEWRFVFVIPPRSEIVCPESNVEKLKWFWATAKLFTAEIDLYQAGQPQGGDGNSNPNVPTNHPVDPGTSGPYQTRFKTKRASGSGKRKAEDVPMITINEASSSKASKPSQLKARKARE